MSDDITPARFYRLDGAMREATYHTAREALDATLRYPGESWLPVRAEALCAALFGVLMHSQQERALEALGWRKVPPPAPSAIRPDPARVGPGDVEYASWFPVGVMAVDPQTLTPSTPDE